MLRATLWLLRVCAYIYHLLLGLFLIGIGTVATASQSELTLGMLPWKGPALTRAVFLLGIAGIVFVALAVTGIARWIFPFWTLFVFVMMFRGFFGMSYTFASTSEFHAAVWLTAGALVAFLASLSLFGRKRARR